MRSVKMVFFRNTECECGVVDGFGERRKLRAGFNSDPENAGSLCGWKEAVAAEGNFDGLGSDARERALDFFHRLSRLLAYEFQRDMQGLRTDPAGVRGKPAHTFHEAQNALADGVVNVE